MGDTGYTEHKEMFLSKEYPIQTKHFHRLVWVTERACFDDGNVLCSHLPAQSFPYQYRIQVQKFNYVSQGYFLEPFTALLLNMLWV